MKSIDVRMGFAPYLLRFSTERNYNNDGRRTKIGILFVLLEIETEDSE